MIIFETKTLLFAVIDIKHGAHAEGMTLRHLDVLYKLPTPIRNAHF